MPLQQPKMTPIDKQKHFNFDNKQSLSRKMKTIQSIGTFNETPEQFERSFVINQKSQIYNKPFMLQDRHKDTASNSNLSKLSKIQSELSDISKMKNMYQSRLQKDHHIKNNCSNKSIQKYSAGKSAEKHILKPTNTPCFNKFQQKKQTNNSNLQQQNCYKPKGIQKSVVFMKNVQAQQVNQNQGIQLTNRNDDEFQYQFYPQSSTKKIQQNQHHQKYFPLSKKIDFQENNKKDLELSDIKIQNLNTKNQFTQNKSLRCNCDCDIKMQNFIESFESKLIEAFERIKKLQEKNYLSQKRAQQLQNQSKINQQKVIQMKAQKERLQQSEYACRMQKQELELMLKDVLFKRQRQRLQQSKQNTHRHSTSQNQYVCSYQNTPSPNQTDYHKKNQQNTNGQKNRYKQTCANQKSIQNRILANKTPSNTMNQNNSNTGYNRRIKVDQNIGYDVCRSKDQNQNKIQSLLKKLQINVERT